MQTPVGALIQQVNDLNGFSTEEVRIVVQRGAGEMVATVLKARRELLDRVYNIQKNEAALKRHKAQKLRCWDELWTLGEDICEADRLRIESYIEEAEVKMRYIHSLKEQWALEMTGILEDHKRSTKRVSAILENNR